MNFDLSEDEALLKALVERFAVDRYDLDRRRCYRSGAQGFSDENWTLLSNLGLIGASYPIELGGMGASQADILVIFETFGRALVVEPIADASVLAGGILEKGGDAELAAHWLPGLVAGKLRVALAHHERDARDAAGWVETRAALDGARLSLTGRKAGVAHAVGADGFIVSARHAHGGEIELYLVAAGTPGLEIEPYRRIDGAVVANLRLEDVTISQGARLRGGLAAIEDGEARANIARLSEAVGIMETLFAITVEYLRQRQQFGRTLGAFQALQHRMVAQYAALEQARSLLYLAVMTTPDDRGLWLKKIAGARAFIGEASVALGHEAIQLHGGMGVSDELIVGHAHKRLLVLSRMHGSTGAALDRYAGVG